MHEIAANENHRSGIRRVTVIGHGAVGSALVDEWSVRGELYSVWDPKPERCMVPPAGERWSPDSDARLLGDSDARLLPDEGVGNVPDANEGERMVGHKKASGDLRTSPSVASDLGDWIFLAVRDASIASVVDELASIPCDWSQKTVLHLSGSLGLSLLQPIAEKGASIASMHPLQTFTFPSGRSSLAGIFYSLMGDDAVTSTLKNWVMDVGGTCERVTEEQKQQLHLAAVFGSNYMVALFRVVESILGETFPVSVLDPIVRTTLDKILAQGASNSLSGPVQRGDVDTVRRHLGQLQGDPARLRLYRLLGLEALRIAEGDGADEHGSDGQSPDGHGSDGQTHIASRRRRLEELRTLLEEKLG